MPLTSVLSKASLYTEFCPNPLEKQYHPMQKSLKEWLCLHATTGCREFS